MTAALITAPALEPVSLADAKAHLRLDSDDDDQLITAAIVAARVHVEALTRRLLIEQGWRVYLDQWPRETHRQADAGAADLGRRRHRL